MRKQRVLILIRSWSVGAIAILCACLASAQQPVYGAAVVEEPARTWEFGALVSGGFAPDYQERSLLDYEEELLFFTAGVQAGRMITRPHGPGLIRGRGEMLVELDPVWMNYEPRQADVIQNVPPGDFVTATFPGYQEYGAAVTPVLFRWNFQQSARQRFAPWLEAGAGLLWTAHEFPQGGEPEVPHSNTSRINFTPQFGAGERIFVGRHGSINMGVRFIYVNSAYLGEYDPGVDSLQFTLGYSWWKK